MSLGFQCGRRYGQLRVSSESPNWSETMLSDTQKMSVASLVTYRGKAAAIAQVKLFMTGDMLIEAIRLIETIRLTPDGKIK